jgi:hypothetical protein
MQHATEITKITRAITGETVARQPAQRAALRLLHPGMQLAARHLASKNPRAPRSQIREHL